MKNAIISICTCILMQLLHHEILAQNEAIVDPFNNFYVTNPISTSSASLHPAGLNFGYNNQTSFYLDLATTSLRFLTSAPKYRYISGYSATDMVSNEWYRRNQDGTDSEVMTLYRNGDLYIKTLLNIGDRKNMQYDDATGQVGWDNSSRRYKINITTLDDDWVKILKTRPVKYSRPLSPQHWEYGYIAEEMDSIGLTNLVGYDQKGVPDDVKYDKMVVYLTEMIKIQQSNIVSLQLELEDLGQRQKDQNQVINQLLTNREINTNKIHNRQKPKNWKQTSQ